MAAPGPAPGPAPGEVMSFEQSSIVTQRVKICMSVIGANGLQHIFQKYGLDCFETDSDAQFKKKMKEFLPVKVGRLKASFSKKSPVLIQSVDSMLIEVSQKTTDSAIKAYTAGMDLTTLTLPKVECIDGVTTKDEIIEQIKSNSRALKMTDVVARFQRFRVGSLIEDLYNYDNDRGGFTYHEIADLTGFSLTYVANLRWFYQICSKYWRLLVTDINYTTLLSQKKFFTNLSKLSSKLHRDLKKPLDGIMLKINDDQSFNVGEVVTSLAKRSKHGLKPYLITDEDRGVKAEQSDEAESDEAESDEAESDPTRAATGLEGAIANLDTGSPQMPAGPARQPTPGE